MQVLKNFTELNEQEKIQVITNIRKTDFIENLATELIDNYQYEDALYNFKYEYENYDGMYFTKKKFIIARNNDNFILEEHNKSFDHFVRQNEISTIDQCVEFIKKSFYDFKYTKGIYSGYEILGKDATTFLFFLV